MLIFHYACARPTDRAEGIILGVVRPSLHTYVMYMHVCVLGWRHSQTSLPSTSSMMLVHIVSRVTCYQVVLLPFCGPIVLLYGITYRARYLTAVPK